MRGLVLGGHQVHDVALRADKEDLEYDVVDALGAKEVCVVAISHVS